MKKKILGKTLRKLTDDFYWDDKPEEEWSNTFDGFKVINVGDWRGGAPTRQDRTSIIQEIATGKFYKFEEEAETGVDMFVTMWENYPSFEEQEIECEEVIPKEVTIITWETVKDMGSLFKECKSIADSRTLFKECATGTQADMSKNTVKIFFKDNSVAEINKDTWTNIRGW